jgi:hypothetical protein
LGGTLSEFSLLKHRRAVCELRQKKAWSQKGKVIKRSGFSPRSLFSITAKVEAGSVAVHR